MLKVGLTGGIGSGKSTISRLLKERSIPVIDSDKIARIVLEIYPDLLEELKNEFGEKFFDTEGNLLRRELGDYVFQNEEKRKRLEALILPYIIKEINKKLELHSKMKEKICIVDAPILIESGLHEKMDINILVWVDRETQIQRVMERDNMTKENVLNRIDSQMPLEEKKNYVDFIIDNSLSINETEKQMDKILTSLETI